jgi:hypothetical protein
VRRIRARILYKCASKGSMLTPNFLSPNITGVI